MAPNGSFHPPRNRAVWMPPTTNIAAYSAKKKNENRRPLYSVWNPATSSDSDSGRSKGARLLLARLATK